jgi:hypothetical protein
MKSFNVRSARIQRKRRDLDPWYGSAGGPSHVKRAPTAIELNRGGARRYMMGKYLIGWLMGVPMIVLVVIYLLNH